MFYWLSGGDFGEGFQTTRNSAISVGATSSWETGDELHRRLRG